MEISIHVVFSDPLVAPGQVRVASASVKETAVPTSPTAQYTDFSKDVLGRYVCNGLDEAMRSIGGRADARPFDIIIIGGGAFGGALAQHLLYSDKLRNHRILVLEAGPFVFAEHAQNLPNIGVVAPGPVVIDPGVLRAEVWGLPWRTNVSNGFPGLAYCIGGRSVFFGGWSPQLLDAEMPAPQWPAQVVQDLNNKYFRDASVQIGVDETNDFVFGRMHRTLRTLLAAGLNAVTAAIPLADLPSPPWPVSASGIEKLEAPLAVQGRPPRSGFFPINKFSSVPLVIRATRQAWIESGGDDVRKRLMVVPNCHVTSLETSISQGSGQVTVVHTNKGSVQVPPRGVVVLAAGTIESTRLALLSFQGVLCYDLIGTNLVSHLRSNYAFRLPRAAFPNLGNRDLQASALFVKCRTNPHPDGSVSHFHLQITGSGLKGLDTNSEAELFQKIPDVDTIDVLRLADEDSVVVNVRGVGEIQPGNPQNRVTLSAETDEFQIARAFVSINLTQNDNDTWDAMDAGAEQVRQIFAAPAGAVDVLRNRDGLGTTHHEGGTLRMGVSPTESVTTPHARFHHVVNAYVAGPALLPSLGSPNPMLSGVALARRIAEHLVAPLPPPQLEANYEWLFDGTVASFANWQQAGPGNFEYDGGEQVLVARPGPEIGLLFYTGQAFSDFTLRLQFRVDAQSDNSGIFVRFRDPRNPPPAGLNDPRIAGNPAWLAVDTGFEAQVDDAAQPDQADKHRTGAIYDVEIGPALGQQQYARGSSLQPGEWNDLEITVQGDSYQVLLNGFQTTSFTNTDVTRGRSAGQDPLSGLIGLQTHTGAVAFRAVRILPV
jgi:choline dehydrogenase-like flavoprotein